MTTEALSRRSAMALAAGAAAFAAAAPALASDQPNMQSALDHLHKAKEFLEKAKANKDGHRNDAMALVDRAIEQVKKGMEAV